MAENKNTSAGQGDELVAANQDSEKTKSDRREIKGGIPYTPSPGTFKKALELIIQAERPDKVSTNFMSTILKLTGGGARAVPPLLKKMQFVSGDGAPTILYSKFKTDAGRSQAAYDGLKNAFSELFRRNEFIHKADENSVKDTIVEITGLKKSDQIVRLMYASFDALRGFITSDVSGAAEASPTLVDDEVGGVAPAQVHHTVMHGQLGLSYQINIILPETDNIAVFNAIFQSLRENLLR